MNKIGASIIAYLFWLAVGFFGGVFFSMTFLCG